MKIKVRDFIQVKSGFFSPGPSRQFNYPRFEDLPVKVFIFFSNREQAWPNTHKAYEIDPAGKGKKIFLRSFDVYGL